MCAGSCPYDRPGLQQHLLLFSTLAGVNRQLGLSDQLFALADTALLTVLGQVAFMPLLVLAARICPEVSAARSSCSSWLDCGCLPPRVVAARIRPEVSAARSSCSLFGHFLVDCGYLPPRVAAARICPEVSGGGQGAAAVARDGIHCVCVTRHVHQQTNAQTGAAGLLLVALAARLTLCRPCSCPSSPQGVEATLFATLMSLLNSGTFVGSALGSALTAWLGVTSGGEGAQDACQTPRWQPCAWGMNYWALRAGCPARHASTLHRLCRLAYPTPHQAAPPP